MRMNHDSQHYALYQFAGSDLGVLRYSVGYRSYTWIAFLKFALSSLTPVRPVIFLMMSQRLWRVHL
jgi:hypothetical protein